MSHAVRIGTVGWAIPKAEQPDFAGDGSWLARYARVFSMVEIDSTFRRRHRPATFARWAATVPDAFRFAVKMPAAITHEAQLADARALDEFLDDVAGLGPKLGVLLVQLAPRHEFDAARARRFLTRLRARHGGAVVVEPRHATWFERRAHALLARWRIDYVVADPPRGAMDDLAALATHPRPILYARFHGTPVMYRSPYGERVDAITRAIASSSAAARWIVFDNTAEGAACTDALRAVRVQEELSRGSSAEDGRSRPRPRRGEALRGAAR